jgi:hypothetical protein
MVKQNFQIDIDDQSVSVLLNISKQSPHRRFYACILYIALGALGMCVLLFAPGKHGDPSMWHDLTSEPADSGMFVFGLGILIGTPLLIFLVQRRYIVFANPSDETLRCDRASLTVSRVRWLDFSNTQWDTRTYTLGEIENLRYKIIATSGGASIYGLRFRAGGETHRILPGLKPLDADKILKALKAFGVDIPDDPGFLKTVEMDAAGNWKL